jgi:hypothetical protein
MGDALVKLLHAMQVQIFPREIDQGLAANPPRLRRFFAHRTPLLCLTRLLEVI